MINSLLLRKNTQGRRWKKRAGIILRLKKNTKSIQPSVFQSKELFFSLGGQSYGWSRKEWWDRMYHPEGAVLERCCKIKAKCPCYRSKYIPWKWITMKWIEKMVHPTNFLDLIQMKIKCNSNPGLEILLPIHIEILGWIHTAHLVWWLK